MQSVKYMKESFLQGFEYARDEYEKISARPQSSQDWVNLFYGLIGENTDVNFSCGVASFITGKETTSLDVRAFNKELSGLAHASEQYLSDSRIVDLLVKDVVEVPAELRPDYVYDSISGRGSGKLGRIYMAEVGMHMYLPYCDVFDADSHELQLCEGVPFEATCCKLSEVLTVLQTMSDSDMHNAELASAIERCKVYESGAGTLPGLLRKHGIGVVNLSSNGWHRVNCQDIHAEAMYMVVDESNHIMVTLDPGPWFNIENNPFDATAAGFDISAFIKEALNRAKDIA